MVDSYENIEKNLQKFASMEIIGLAIDRKSLKKSRPEFDQQIEELTQDIYDLAGSEFNINSTKQLGEVLFKDLELPVIKKLRQVFLQMLVF